MNTPEKRFRVAISFAGERREYVAQLAKILANEFGEDKILYDIFHQHLFNVPNLAESLPPLYRNDSELIVVFICKDYQHKPWTGIEWSQIHALIMEKQFHRIFLCRFEYATHPTLPGAGYLDMEKFKPAETAQMIVKRLSANGQLPVKSKSTTEKPTVRRRWPWICGLILFILFVAFSYWRLSHRFSKARELQSIHEFPESLDIFSNVLASTAWMPFTKDIRLSAWDEIGDIQMLQHETMAASNSFTIGRAEARRWGRKIAAATATWRLADLYLRLGEREKSAAMMNDAHMVFSADRNDLGLARTYRGFGDIARFSGSNDVAIAQYKKSQEHFERGKLPLGVAAILINLGAIYEFMGSNALAKAYYRDAANKCSEIGNIIGAINAVLSLGDLELLTDDEEKAEQCFDEAKGLSQQYTYPAGEARAEHGLGQLAERRGQLSVARAHYMKGISMSGSADVLLKPHIQMSLGGLDLLEGRFAEARARFEEARDTFVRFKERSAEANARLELGQVALRENKPPLAREEFTQALQLYKEDGYLRGQANAYLKLGMVARLLREFEVARNHLEQALQCCRKIQSKLGEAQALMEIGYVDYLEGNFEEAKSKVSSVLTILNTMDVKMEAGSAHRLLGFIAIAQKDVKTAKAELQIALGMFQAIGYKAGESEIEQMMKAL